MSTRVLDRSKGSITTSWEKRRLELRGRKLKKAQSIWTDMVCLEVMLILDIPVLVMGHGLIGWVKGARQFTVGPVGCDGGQTSNCVFQVK